MYTGLQCAKLYDTNGPMEKYDDYVNNGGLAKAWEYELWPDGHRTTDPSNSWFGHCNGWSAAAILENEPTTSKLKDGITFTVGDQKGLLTECHHSDPADLWIGERYDGPGDDIWDVYPAVFHRALIDWIGDLGEPIVMDVDRDTGVSNMPAFAYEMSYSPDAYDSSKIHVVTIVTFAISDESQPDYVGTQTTTREYHYWITGNIRYPTGGAWELANNPDFIWHPDYASPSNPYINYNTVLQVVE